MTSLAICRHVYNSLISACASGPTSGYNLEQRCVEQARLLMAEAQAAGHSPDGFTFAAMMRVCARAGMCAPLLDGCDACWKCSDKQRAAGVGWACMDLILSGTALSLQDTMQANVTCSM